MSGDACLLLADFNSGNLAAFLRNDQTAPLLEVAEAPYDQVVPILADAGHASWAADAQIAVVWTRPEAVSPTFSAILRGDVADLGRLAAEVDRYTELLVEAGLRVQLMLVPTWVVPTYRRGLGMSDFRPGGVAHALMTMNGRLVAALAGDPRAYVLDAQKWCERAGAKAFDPKLWYLGKIPFGHEVFKAAIPDIKAALRGVNGRAKKLLVVDLDDTLWGGIVGEVGVEGLILGGHDRLGEAFLDFQRALKALVRRGVLLGIVSKNEEQVALSAINSHPEMVLGRADFAGWRIDWTDKAHHIASLAAELNLGLQDVVFIDDNPTERARVREALPEVLVPDWPADPSHYAATLEQMVCFDAPDRTWEDGARNQMYAEEKERHTDREAVGALDEWLHTLALQVSAERVNRTNVRRTIQLLNKTNQMNLSTRRLSEAELVEWVEQEGREAWVYRVEDRFGDSGLTGILSLQAVSGGGRVVDFVLSCRVMGRGVEETLLHHAVARAQVLGWEELLVEYLPTEKNKPCLDLMSLTLQPLKGDLQLFHWPIASEFPLPGHVEFRS
ncbi:MAG: HAD-IIIC family phosphatase [Candidatus Latescibacterota bacterium]|nr:HAD-IIIC family phosphatase [Candidatus Latescibacterota bacterium]